ncbi:MAG: polyprenyl synthetase family protein [Opitutae bacterium]|nr:polyprenyl synthetase family protein [Opitutae bacterium]
MSSRALRRTRSRRPSASLAAAAAERALPAALQRHLPLPSRGEPRLLAALRQCVAHPGKMIRGRLVLAAALAHGLARARALELATAVEYFHTASLLLDDLPCMDDAVQRRNQLCVHRVHGEATAILAALALINRAYALVASAFARETRAARQRAATALDRALGAAGLVGGQAWDLAFASTERPASLVSRIAAGKTGALLTLALELPAAIARPSRIERRALAALAVYWGQLYQIADDLSDVLDSAAATGKTTGRDRLLSRPNLALALGRERAQARWMRLARQAQRALQTLRDRGGRRWDYLWAAHASLIRRAAPEADHQHRAA